MGAFSCRSRSGTVLRFSGFKDRLSADVEASRPEVFTIRGASYFRPVGTHQRYGSSGRALASIRASRAGEFPRFTEFWLERPADFADHSKFTRCWTVRGSGRFSVCVEAGDTTFVDVEGSMFVRKEGRSWDSRRTTSMFLFGKNKTRLFPTFGQGS
jgi:glucans biosynthesis protein